MASKQILLIVGGGIAAYKCLELARRGAERGLAFTTVMTARAEVICGETYHIKICIGDASDTAYDSAVFLRRYQGDYMAE